MSHSLFWLPDEAWEAIEPRLPKNQPGARRVDDQLVISGIIHSPRLSGRRADCPARRWVPQQPDEIYPFRGTTVPPL
jgi:transposase